MNKQLVKRLRDARGISVIEVMVALLIFTLAILSLASAGFVASQTLRSGRSYMGAWAAAQSKLDSLTAAGWTALGGTSGVDTLQGYPVTWNVQGGNPRRVILVVERSVSGKVFADTFVTYVAQ